MAALLYRRWLLIAAAIGVFCPARGATISVHDAARGRDINPAMWGAFFEDINFGADGGLYAELIKNRGFEFPDPLMGWSVLHPSLADGTVTVATASPFDAANPHYVEIASVAKAPLGLRNEGFRGIGVRAQEPYRFSAFVRRVSGDAQVLVRLYGHDGTVLAEAPVDGAAGQWTRCTAVLSPTGDDEHAWLALLVVGKATVDVDFVSLFPEHTWKHRPGGLRADLVQALFDLRPGFLRFPGGCVVEGSVLPRRYQWKETLGPVERRHVLVNRWNYEFLHRPTPDYYQSFGLGFFEYFQLCEDIGAQPLPIVNCGMACQFNSGEVCPPDQTGNYVQDALDLIEFANGAAETPWGARRAAMGHPAPFHLTMIGVGNEQWGPEYFQRFAQFAAAFSRRHPEIKLVAAAGPSPDGPLFSAAWAHLPALGAGLMDEHSYAPPDWFFDHTGRYDRYRRTGPGVFMGEYAAQSVATVSTRNRNTAQCALAEAAYMIGLEHNADVVRMASYAPLFAHKDAWQWTPDLIWFDNLSVVRTPNYHVQELFSRNRGEVELPCAITGLSGQDGRRVFVAASREQRSGQIILKLVNACGHPVRARLTADQNANPRLLSAVALRADSPDEENSFAEPHRLEPRPALDTAAADGAVVIPDRALIILRLGSGG